MKEKKIYAIHPNFEGLADKVKYLDVRFDSEGETLRDKRNHLKTDSWGSTNVCVKSFKKPHLWNQLVYGYFRRSKAQRSYQYAIALKKMNTHTPRPIGFVECRNKWGGLTESYYACEYETTESRIGDLPTMNLPLKEKEAIISSFVQYTCEHLYDNHMFNKDYNGTNILFDRVGQDTHFSYVDINRLRFHKKMSMRDELNNLNKVSDDPEMLCMLAKSYAQVRQTELKKTTYALFTTKYLNGLKRRTKKKMLRPLKELVSYPSLYHSVH